MLNMVFGLFFNPNQVLLTMFSHSKTRKGVVKNTSKGEFVIVFWIIIIMW